MRGVLLFFLCAVPVQAIAGIIMSSPGDIISSGEGTSSVLPKFGSDGLLSDSLLSDDGSVVTVTANKKLRVTGDSSQPNQWSLIDTDTSKDYTLSQSTNGTNGNLFYGNLSGNYHWGHHINLASGSDGSLAFVFGLHADNTNGLFGVFDVADAHPIKLYHRSSTAAHPFIEMEGETDWYTDYDSGLTPAYSGTFQQHFIRGRIRNVTQFAIDYDGSIYSYADSGNDYTRMYTIANTAGVMRSNVPVARWDEVTGSYIDFSPSLAGNLNTVVSNAGVVTMTPSGGRLILASTGAAAASHFEFSGGAPAVSSCGTSPSVVGSDSAGKVTIGTTASDTCTLTFDSPFAAAPACVVIGDDNAINLAATSSTTALVITAPAATDFSSDVIMYICVGQDGA